MNKTLRALKFIFIRLYHSCPECQSGHLTYVGPEALNELNVSKEYYVCMYCQIRREEDEKLSNRNSSLPRDSS